MSQLDELAALHDMQNRVETAFAAYIGASAASISAFHSRTQEDMPDSRVMIAWLPDAGVQLDSGGVNTGTGYPEWAKYNGTLVLSVQTERVKQEPVAAFRSGHERTIAYLRALMLYGSMAGNVEGVSALSIPDWQVVTSTPSTQLDSTEDDAYDVTELQYALLIRINPANWPEPPPPESP